ncbi:hypothetical protein V1264_023805 [Littorina saxatilis]|uniref:Uncharacterized protein n=2 Tax=Littorina saxatilis TaxID=31220 RepID=A0AAN9BAD6_9CAEN
MGLRAMLCLAVLVAVVDMFVMHPSQRRSAEVDVCTAGSHQWNQYGSCAGYQLGNFTRSLGNTELRTKQNFEDSLKEFCGEILPAIRSCVADRMSGCDRATREQMEQAVQSTGFVCQPGGTAVNPAVVNVLSQISEDDFVQSANCRIRVNAHMCYKEGLEAAGIPFSPQPDEVVPALSNNFSLDTSSYRFVPYMKAFIKCAVSLFREESNDCPAWRADVLVKIVMEMNDAILGMQMPFTIPEWKEMMDV